MGLTIFRPPLPPVTRHSKAHLPILNRCFINDLRPEMQHKKIKGSPAPLCLFIIPRRYQLILLLHRCHRLRLVRPAARLSVWKDPACAGSALEWLGQSFAYLSKGFLLPMAGL